MGNGAEVFIMMQELELFSDGYCTGVLGVQHSNQKALQLQRIEETLNNKDTRLDMRHYNLVLHL